MTKRLNKNGFWCIPVKNLFIFVHTLATSGDTSRQLSMVVQETKASLHLNKE